MAVDTGVGGPHLTWFMYILLGILNCGRSLRHAINLLRITLVSPNVWLTVIEINAVKWKQSECSH